MSSMATAPLGLRDGAADVSLIGVGFNCLLDLVIRRSDFPEICDGEQFHYSSPITISTTYLMVVFRKTNCNIITRRMGIWGEDGSDVP